MRDCELLQLRCKWSHAVGREECRLHGSTVGTVESQPLHIQCRLLLDPKASDGAASRARRHRQARHVNMRGHGQTRTALSGAQAQSRTVLMKESMSGAGPGTCLAPLPYTLFKTHHVV